MSTIANVRRRRRPWGGLWAEAPWDGKPIAATPVPMPATVAGMVQTPPPRAELALGRPRIHRRVAFGTLLAAAPWAGAKSPPPPRNETATTAEAVSFDTVLDTIDATLNLRRPLDPITENH